MTEMPTPPPLPPASRAHRPPVLPYRRAAWSYSPGSLHPRLALTFAVLCTSPGLAALVVAMMIPQPKVSVVALFTLPYIFLSILRIWWHTLARRSGTARLAVALGVLSLAAPVLALLVEDDFTTMVLVLLILGVTVVVLVIGMVVLTLRAWRPLPRTGVICRQCRYDLRGQQSCRCPECGAEYTVGQLIRNRQRPVPIGCVWA